MMNFHARRTRLIGVSIAAVLFALAACFAYSSYAAKRQHDWELRVGSDHYLPWVRENVEAMRDKIDAGCATAEDLQTVIRWVDQRSPDKSAEGVTALRMRRIRALAVLGKFAKTSLKTAAAEAVARRILPETDPEVRQAMNLVLDSLK
jgi:hypothetical protein